MGVKLALFFIKRFGAMLRGADFIHAVLVLLEAFKIDSPDRTELFTRDQLLFDQVSYMVC